jgi:hypothetical protein
MIKETGGFLWRREHYTYLDVSMAMVLKNIISVP